MIRAVIISAFLAISSTVIAVSSYTNTANPKTEIQSIVDIYENEYINRIDVTLFSVNNHTQSLYDTQKQQHVSVDKNIFINKCYTKQYNSTSMQAKIPIINVIPVGSVSAIFIVDVITIEAACRIVQQIADEVLLKIAKK